MALSKVAIANGALQKLGAKRVESLEQNHPNARSMAAAYDSVRRALLRKYNWGFATRRASIAADGDQTTWGGHNRYTVPNDYLRMVRDDESGLNVDWKIESAADGKFIISDDASPLQIKYIADIDDPNYYDALFVEALQTALAQSCCKEVTGSLELKKDLDEEFKDDIAEAKLWGAVEEPAREFPEDDWLTARN